MRRTSSQQPPRLRPKHCRHPTNRFHDQSLPPGSDNDSHPKALCGKRQAATVRVRGHAVQWIMQFTRKGLKAEGFAGFRPIQDLETMRIPQATGLFTVVAPEGFQPRFLTKSTAGVFKKKEPSLSAAALTAEWVEGAVVLYVGKAGPGSKGNRGLRRQIQEFVDFGQGKPPRALGWAGDLAAGQCWITGHCVERTPGGTTE